MTTNELGDLLASLPIDQLAAQVGEQPDDVRQAVEAALPALVGGLQANALGGGLDSLLGALDQHTADVDPTAIDTNDGAKAVSHIFGAQRDDVVQQLSGTSGVSSSLIQKLLPMLAPLVLGWLAKQVAGKSGAAVPSACRWRHPRVDPGAGAVRRRPGFGLGEAVRWRAGLDPGRRAGRIAGRRSPLRRRAAVAASREPRP